MKEILLQGTLGHAQMDALVQEVVQVYEETFPGHIGAYYLEGSYADHTALGTSDLDLVIIFRTPFVDADARSGAEQTWRRTHGGTPEVDITVIDEPILREGVSPSVKLGGRLIYGQDVCSHVPLLPIDVWTRERMHAAYWLLIHVYQRRTPVHLPLTFPSPSDEFYGYTNRTLRLPDGRDVPCTRNLVRTTGWAATALLALQAGQYVASKRDGVRLYRVHIGDEWTSLLEAMARFCRDEWQYLLPSTHHARKHLRELCAQTLRFEQHFLTCYTSYLLAQLRSKEQERVRVAMQLQEQFPLEDAQVTAKLQTLGQREETPNDGMFVQDKRSYSGPPS